MAQGNSKSLHNAPEVISAVVALLEDSGGVAGL